MRFHMTDDVRLILPQAALRAIFDECDGFDQDETGGRVVGTYQEHGGKLALHITGIIEAGPQAQRSAVSFFQDGAHQERVFRQIESSHPEIEHLGNWHTHHVNGLQHLSGGDIETYHRTVNHRNHNTPFFYALLIAAKHRTSDPLRRYTVKHYIFRRGDERVYEIPQHCVEIVDEPLLWPLDSTHHLSRADRPLSNKLGAHPGRVYDRDILGEFYRGLRSFTSPKLGLYWRGPLELSDGSNVQVVLLEDAAGGTPTYSVTLREPPDSLRDVAEELAEAEFPSARAALIITERSCNRALTSAAAGKKHSPSHERGVAMDVFTLYVGQGALAAVRAGDEAIVIDAHMPDTDDVTLDQIEQSLNSYLSKKKVRGLILTGLDKDHACPAGVESILTHHEPDWIMYPTCYKPTDTASEVFAIIDKHEKRRKKTSHPLVRKSVRVDNVDSRTLTGLAKHFTFELFSPHMDDMDSSNNSSIVLKLTGLDATGFRYLITGDTETERWDSISRYFGKYLASDVMAAAHHGSTNGVNARALTKITPHTVLISAGVGNSYGHPDGAAVKAYKAVAKHVFCTNTPPDGTCFFTRRVGDDFETRDVRHPDAVAADAP